MVGVFFPLPDGLFARARFIPTLFPLGSEAIYNSRNRAREATAHKPFGVREHHQSGARLRCALRKNRTRESDKHRRKFILRYKKRDHGGDVIFRHSRCAVSRPLQNERDSSAHSRGYETKALKKQREDDGKKVHLPGEIAGVHHDRYSDAPTRPQYPPISIRFGCTPSPTNVGMEVA